MVVYGDILFVLNLVLDYGLLMATARIAGCPFVRLRLLAGALFGGLYALLIFVPGLQFLSALPVRLCAGVGMALIAFGGQRRFFHLLGVLAGVTAALGGGVLALTAVGSATLYGGVVGTGSDFLAVVLAGAVGNLIDRAFLRFVTDMFRTLVLDFPVFNVADICVVLGGIALCVYVIFFYDKYEKREKQDDAAPSDG